jgi:hypothetical protein
MKKKDFINYLIDIIESEGIEESRWESLFYTENDILASEGKAKNWKWSSGVYNKLKKEVINQGDN